MKKMCLLIIGLAFIFAFSHTSCEIHSEEKNPAIENPDNGNTDNPNSGNMDNPGNDDEPVTPNPSWVYNDLNIQKFHKLGITGKGIKIAVGDGNSNKVPTDEKMNIVGANVNGTGTNDHIYGTISVMASKEFGIAPEADYYFLNFVPQDGDLIGLSQAIRWCADNVDLMVLACGWKKNNFSVLLMRMKKLNQW